MATDNEIHTDPETGQQYIVIEVNCMGCGKSMSPQETEMELWRLGVPVHLESINPACMKIAAEYVQRRISSFLR